MQRLPLHFYNMPRNYMTSRRDILASTATVLTLQRATTGNLLIYLNQTLGEFSRRQTGDMCLIFPRKKALTFDWRQFTWNVKTSFQIKIRKKINMWSTKNLALKLTIYRRWVAHTQAVLCINIKGLNHLIIYFRYLRHLMWVCTVRQCPFYKDTRHKWVKL